MSLSRHDIIKLMNERVLLLDGATGTYLQQLKLTEEDFRGSLFADHPVPLKGCNDVLCLTKPEAIIAMHRAYIEAGADIIETNSFNCNCFSLADYGLQDRVYEISKAAAECARKAATAPIPNPSPIEGKGVDSNEGEKYAPSNVTTPFPSAGEGLGKGAAGGSAGTLIAGSVGPTNRTLSMSADVNNPAQRDITFDELYATYKEQVRGLLDGGADIILFETVFDTLNTKAGIKAVIDLQNETGRDIPVMISATLSDASGRTLSGQTVEAFVASVAHANPISIGLNCGFGARQLLPWLRRLAKVAPCAVSVHPNAGLPNVMGGYDETPETFAEVAKEVFQEGLVRIYGGCCGTTPEHIRALAAQLSATPTAPLCPSDISPIGEKNYSNEREKFTPSMILSGLECLNIPAPSASSSKTIPSTTTSSSTPSPSNVTSLSPMGEMSEGQRGAAGASFISIGERTNVAGSAKFKKLIQAGSYEEALSVARQQVDNGAQVIDVCMDDGLIDGVKAMTHFLNLIASEPEIAKVPVMIDSSKWEIIEAGLQCVQGKSIVNSISLKEGEEKFLQKARHIHSMGAATVVMLFDENGQADTYERKVSVARRAYKLLRSIGFPGEDIIFDPNVLAVATGMPEHNDYGRAFIEACRTIHEEMPEVHMSGGISNLSFSFRGNNTVRQAMHSVFLYHAKQAGLDMSIVNPAMLTIYDEIPSELRKRTEDVILNTDEDAAERLIDFAQQLKAEEDAAKEANGGKPVAKEKAPESLEERITHAMLKGLTDNIEAYATEAFEKEGSSLAVIEKYLMPAMEEVGRLFGEGKMFLPQVVKSARVMKKAIAPILTAPAAPLSTTPTAPLCPSDISPEGEKVDSNKGEKDSSLNISDNSIASSASENNNGNASPANVTSLSTSGEMSAGQRGAERRTEKGAIILATVKGDVHDIGKNIVGVVMQCNGFDVKDLGVMVEPETIVDEAIRCNAAAITLSGLITPSLTEMINVLRLLEKRGLTIPVIVGGATTSALHTAVKMAPEYPHGIVIRAHAAADNPGILRRLLADDSEEYKAELRSQQRIIRENYMRKEADKGQQLSIEEARRRRHVKRMNEIATPLHTDAINVSVRLNKIKPFINWNMFLQAWQMKGEARQGDEAKHLLNDAQHLLYMMQKKKLLKLNIMARVLPAESNDNDEILIHRDSETFTLPMPRSLRDEEETHCLADYIARPLQALQISDCPCCRRPHRTDFICPFVVTAGVGIKELQEQFRSEGDEYHAIMVKLLADRLAEALAEYLSKELTDTLHWGSRNIRMAFGYGACPEHRLKQQVFDILHAEEHLPLRLTDTYMITPEETICGLIFAETPEKYFNV